MEVNYLWVKGSLDVSTFLCFLNLAIFLAATICVVFDDNDPQQSATANSIHMPIIGLCYAALSGTLLYGAITKLSIIQTIPVTIFSRLFANSEYYFSKQTSLETITFALLSTTIIWIVAALICNCSRAFYTLNSLEKGKLNGGEFGDHYSSSFSRIVEFSIRIVAIILFILIEQILAELSQLNNLADLMARLGIICFFLYGILLIWVCKNWYEGGLVRPASIHSVIQFVGGIFISIYLSLFLIKDIDSIKYEQYNLIFLVTFLLAILGSILVIVITTYYALINIRVLWSNKSKIFTNILNIFRVSGV